MNGCHFGDFRVRMLLLGGLALLLTAVFFVSNRKKYHYA